MSAVQKLGRPTEFTPALGRRICARVAKVGFEAVAAELVGIHRHTLRNWRERGEKGEEPFAEFAAELAAAKAQYIRGELDKVEDPRWRLERVDRELFGASQKVEHTGKDGGAIAHRHTHTLTRDQSLEIVSKVLGVGRHLVEGKFKGRQLAADAGDVVDVPDDE
jgi:hypothetical protein